jgi:Kef-type K+ transport system membrane component KefB
MTSTAALADEAWYILLVFALFVLPQMLQRLRIPSAITSMGMGILCGLGFGLFQTDPTVGLLATFGIVALFLFAGLEVDFAELRRHAPLLASYLTLRLATLAGVAYAAGWALGIELRAGFILALALLTPSTGFILSSLARFGMDEAERSQVKIKAIASELLALALLFVCVQSDSGERLLVSGTALVGLIAALPVAFWLFARYLVPHAPKSEFAFLLMLAVLCAWATRLLGAYYLLGAFIAGIIAQRTRSYLPEMVSPRTLHAIEVFASFFVPFYFFHAGLGIRAEDFTQEALLIGASFLALALPLRFGALAFHRRLMVRESWTRSRRVATALLPTLVFTLVLATVLRERFAIPEPVYGGLVIYALANTLLPSLILHTSAAVLEFTRPELTREARAVHEIRFDIRLDPVPGDGPPAPGEVQSPPEAAPGERVVRNGA